MRLGRITLYVRDIEASVEFYQRHFGFRPVKLEGDRIVELTTATDGANIMLHKAAKSQKAGQVLVKLVFDVEDVEKACEECAANGLHFGPRHSAEGYVFANAKDPDGNPIALSSRAFARR